MAQQEFARFVNCTFFAECSSNFMSLGETGRRFIKGKLDPKTASAILRSKYGRDTGPPKVISLHERRLQFAEHSNETIVLAVRGRDFTERADGEIFISDVFVIDGWRRLSALKVMLENPVDYPNVPFLQAIVWLDVDDLFERQLFWPKAD